MMKKRKRRSYKHIAAPILRLVAVTAALFAVRAVAAADFSLPDIENIEKAALWSEFGVPFTHNDPMLRLLALEFPNVKAMEDPVKVPDSPDFESGTVPYYSDPEIKEVMSEDTSPDPHTEDTPSAASAADGQGEAVSTTITGQSGTYSLGADGIYIKNGTGYDIDLAEYLSAPLIFDENSEKKVLIIHTHGSEAYSASDGDDYIPSDPYRTTDTEHNVVKVGDELEKVLTERGVTVIHEKTLFDYPNYNGAYSRSWEKISAMIESDPDIVSVIDLHRDALEGDDGTVYKTVADVGDEPCAQVMIICGTDYSGLNHPNWRENLKFASRIQAGMVNKYPSLARPLNISAYRYNQHATVGSLIVEVGCSGNTLSEAENAVRYFGDCLADVLTGE